MKQRLLAGLPVVVTGMLLAAVPGHLLPVCAVRDGAPPMKCHWSGNMLAGFGWTFVALGILLFLCRSREMRQGISLASLALAATAALVPTHLIGMCASPTMPCRMGTYPAVMILLAMLALENVLNILFLRHRQESLAHETAHNLHHSPEQS